MIRNEPEKNRNNAADLKGAAEDTKFFRNHSFRILSSLRKITHSVAIYSKKLKKIYGITGPQLLCLYAIEENGPTTLTEISKLISLSSSTILGIVDRLEKKDLVERRRDSKDRRKVFITTTSKGSEFALNAPMLLEDKVAEGILKKDEKDQAAIAWSLEQIVTLMDENCFSDISKSEIESFEKNIR